MNSSDASGAGRRRSSAPLLCLLNGAARSGGAEGQRRAVADAFARLGQEVRIEMPPDCGRIEALARQAAQGGAPLVIAGGGDGTMNAAANALAGTATALGVLPLGTLNHFAKDLGIPLQLDAAAANVLSGAIRAVDAAEVNGRIFVNNSSIGLYPSIVRGRDTLQGKGRGKWAAFAHAALKALHRSHSLRLELSAPGRSLKIKTEFVLIGNNEYELAVARIGGRLRLDRGVLWIYRLPHVGRVRAILATLPALVALDRPKAPLAFCSQTLRIGSRKAMLHVAVDGEVLRMQTPLRYRSRPEALRVVVPGTDL